MLKEYGEYDSLMRTFTVDSTNEKLKKFLFDTATLFRDEVIPFKPDEISDALNELLITVNTAREKYEKQVASEIKKYEDIIYKDKKSTYIKRKWVHKCQSIDIHHLNKT